MDAGTPNALRQCPPRSQVLGASVCPSWWGICPRSPSIPNGGQRPGPPPFPSECPLLSATSLLQDYPDRPLAVPDPVLWSPRRAPPGRLCPLPAQLLALPRRRVGGRAGFPRIWCVCTRPSRSRPKLDYFLPGVIYRGPWGENEGFFNITLQTRPWSSQGRASCRRRLGPWWPGTSQGRGRTVEGLRNSHEGP